MKSLTVLYDAKCGLCLKAKHWTVDQPSYFPLRFIPQGGAEAERRYPDLVQQAEPEELIAISDTGQVYRDDNAWLITLYALRRYRPLAIRLSRPAFRGLARRAYHWVASNRYWLSSWLGESVDGQLARRLAEEPDPPKCQPPKYTFLKSTTDEHIEAVPLPDGHDQTFTLLADPEALAPDKSGRGAE